MLRLDGIYKEKKVKSSAATVSPRLWKEFAPINDAIVVVYKNRWWVW